MEKQWRQPVLRVLGAQGVARSKRDASVLPLGRRDPECGDSGHQKEPSPGGQHNDEGLVNDVPAETTTPGRFKAPPMFLGALRRPPGSFCSSK